MSAGLALEETAPLHLRPASRRRTPALGHDGAARGLLRACGGADASGPPRPGSVGERRRRHLRRRLWADRRRGRARSRSRSPTAIRAPRRHRSVLARVPRTEIFRRTGIQFMPINTITSSLRTSVTDLAGRHRRVLMPDLCHLFLSGSRSGDTPIRRRRSCSTRRRGSGTTRCSRGSVFRGADAGARRSGRRFRQHSARAASQDSGRSSAAERSDSRDRTSDTRHRASASSARRSRRARHSSRRDIVVGRRRARRAAPDRRSQGRELHQRGRHQRHHSLPEERDGAVGLEGCRRGGAAPPPDIDALRRRSRRAVRAGRRRRSSTTSRLLQPAEHDSRDSTRS